MRNGLIRAISLVLALLVVLPLGLHIASATTYVEEEITYTVTIEAGRQGSLTGSVSVYPKLGESMSTVNVSIRSSGSRIIVSGLKYEQRVVYDAAEATTDGTYKNVALKDPEKYYVRGLRKAGRDNTEIYSDSEVGTGTIKVTCDEEYVVGYGIRGDMVAYTVRYLDLDGNPLAPNKTYFGNVGDRPVVAYLYIDGYRPQAYNLIKTLQADSAKNIFTFVYKKLSVVTGGGGGQGGQPTQPTDPTATTVETEPTETTIATETTEPTETTEVTETTEPTETTEATEVTEATIPPVTVRETEPPYIAPIEPTEEPTEPTEERSWIRRFFEGLFGNNSDEPSELMELDDWQIPLAGIFNDAAPAARVAVSGVCAAAGVAGLILLILLLGKKRKKKDQEKPGQDPDNQEKHE